MKLGVLCDCRLHCKCIHLASLLVTHPPCLFSCSCRREKRGWTGDSQLTSAEASLNFDMKLLYGNWLRTMRDHDVVGCAASGHSPAFPQSNVDICCDPAKKTFGCDYAGVPEGAFANTSGAIADVVPFTYVGGWPGDPSWGIIGAVLPWEVWRSSGDDSIVKEYYDVCALKPSICAYISHLRLDALRLPGGRLASVSPLPAEAVQAQVNSLTLHTARFCRWQQVSSTFSPRRVTLRWVASYPLGTMVTGSALQASLMVRSQGGHTCWPCHTCWTWQIRSESPPMWHGASFRR